MNCKHCEKRFKKGDQIVVSNAQGGGSAHVHEICHLDWVLRWDSYSYISYEELSEEYGDE